MAQQVVMVMPLLEGLDGVKKMSKSSGNYVGVSEEPNEMFGKLMSVSDELMDRYYLLLLGEKTGWVVASDGGEEGVGVEFGLRGITTRMPRRGRGRIGRRDFLRRI